MTSEAVLASTCVCTHIVRTCKKCWYGQVELYGEKTFIYPNKELSQNKDQYPFFQDWFILVDMQLGGNWVGAIDEEDLPVEMEIDWIKHYKRVRK